MSSHSDPGSFGSLLRAARKARRLTQDDCATRAGIGVRTLRDLERGNARPQQATVDLLVAALGVTGDERDQLVAASGRAASPTGPVINLPPRPVLVGREADTASLAAALGRRTLVTLVGVAGVGKTSLAIALAHHVAPSYPGGTSAVVISEVSTETDILTAIAGVFDVARASDLQKRFADRDALLVVDALERAPDPTRAALARLSTIAPTLHIIATGRHPIGLSHEMARVVAPLDVPPADAGNPEKYPAVELFLARLDSVRRQPLGPSEHAVVGTLVRRLGGLPLALELAAARGRVLDMHEILERYGDRVLDLADQRGQRLRASGVATDDRAAAEALPTTLRDAVGESYRLLDPTGQSALRRLASFRHRWSLEMAEPLLAPAFAPIADPVGALDRLVGLGLVQILGSGPVRFRMLDVVRDFAAEQRDASGESEAAADAHAQVIGAVVNRIGPDLVGAGFLGAVRRLDDIASDIRAALDHASRSLPLVALSIAAALPRWWRFRGRDREGREILRALLDSPATASADPSVRAWAQLGAQSLALEHGDALAELRSARAALATFADLDDVTGQLAAHTQLVAVYHSDGAYERAREHGAAALALATRAGRRRDILVASTNLTWHDIRTGDLAAARHRLTSLRKLAGELGEDRLASLALANLTEVERLDRRYDEAIATGQRAVALLEQHGDPRHRRSVQCTVTTALAEAGRLAEARAMLESLRMGGPDQPDGPISLIEAYLALGEGDRKSAARWFAAARHTLVGQPDVRDVVEALVGFAATAPDPVEAARARAELELVCATSAVTLLPRDRRLLAG